MVEINHYFYSHTGGLVLPRGAEVTFGSGEFGEAQTMENSEPGDVYPGVLDHVPPARTEYMALDIGQITQITLKGERLEAAHWGDGVLLLQRDWVRIRERYLLVF